MEYRLEKFSQETLQKHINLCSTMYSRKRDKKEGFKTMEELEQFTQSKLIHKNPELLNTETMVFAYPQESSNNEININVNTGKQISKEPIGVVCAKDIDEYKTDIKYFKNLKFMKHVVGERKYFKIVKKLKFFEEGYRTCYFHSGYVIQKYQFKGVMENMLRLLAANMLNKGFTYGITIVFLPIHGYGIDQIQNHYYKTYGKDAIQFLSSESLVGQDMQLMQLPTIVILINLKKALKCEPCKQLVPIKPKL